MMRFIHLLLLLATVQSQLASAEVIPLPEGINVTFSLPGNFESCAKDGCGNTVSCVSELIEGSNNILSLDTLGLSDGGTYCCRTSNDDCRLDLKVVRGCIKSFLIDVEFTQDHILEINGSTTDKCVKACTYLHETCDYFTFHKSNKQCSLMGPSDRLKIRRNTDTTSGYSRRHCSTTGFSHHGSWSESGKEDSDQSSPNADLQFHNATRSWFAALWFCKASQKHKLVQITNDTVMEKVKQLMVNQTNVQNGVWVGLERPIFGVNTTWRWITEGSFNASMWNSSFPPTSSNKYCGKMIWANETQTIKLLDDDCFMELPYICQEEDACVHVRDRS